MKDKRKLAVIAAVIMALVFVSMGVWVRMMSESFGNFQQVYLRAGIAAIIASVVFRSKFDGLFKNISRREWFIYIGRAIMVYGIGVVAGTFAVQHAELSTVGFISSLPILGLLAWIMFREKVPKAAIPCIFLSIVGLGLVANIDLASFGIGKGELAAIIGMLGFGIGYLMSRLQSSNKNNFENTTLLLMFAWIMPLILSITTGERLVPSSITTAAFTGLIASSLMNILLMYLTNFVFANLKAYVAGNILLLEGPFALFIGYLLYNESPSIWSLFGGIIIIGCAFAINIIEQKSKSKHKIIEQVQNT